jgi:hypothetical protein
MKHVFTTLLATVIAGSLLASTSLAAEPPARRVLALYFHRTERCPTCQKMGSYAEAAVKQGFAAQLKDGTVAFHYIDFEDKKNAKLAKGYKVSDPALIVAKIEGNKVREYEDLEDIWTHVEDKQAFIKYVQQHISAYLTP